MHGGALGFQIAIIFNMNLVGQTSVLRREWKSANAHATSLNLKLRRAATPLSDFLMTILEWCIRIYTFL